MAHYHLPKVFFPLILLVSIILVQYHLFSPVFKLGWAQDDWLMRGYYQAIAAHPLKFLPEVIKMLGPYTTQEYYIGVLTNLIGPNYNLFRIFSFLYKAFVALAIYLLVIEITKDRLIAVGSSLLYAISYTSAESIQFIIASTEYLVQLTFCIFLWIYYRLITINTKSVKWLLLFLLTFMLNIAFSPIRAFPILAIPFLVESFTFILTKKLNLKEIFIRLAVLSPVYILVIFMMSNQKIITNDRINVVIASILEGNWFEVVIPFTGLGTLILPDQPWMKIFGPVTTILSTPLSTFILFILERPSLVFSLTTFLFSQLLAANKKAFFFRVMLLNYILQISAFLFFMVNSGNNKDYFLELNTLLKPFNLYPAMGGIFIFTLSCGFFWEWVKSKKPNNYLFLLWVGPWFSLSVVTIVWLLAHRGFVFTPVHRYFLIAHFGTILFLAALLRLTLQRIFENKSNLQRGLSYTLLLALVLIYYKIGYNEIRKFYSYPLSTGMAAEDNEYMQQRFLQIHPLSKIINSEPSIYYFDLSDDLKNSFFYSRSFIDPLLYWVTILKQPTSKTCTTITADNYEIIKQAVIIKDNNKMIRIRGHCFDPQTGTVDDNAYFEVKPEYIYAYKIKDNSFIDIRPQVLSSLGL